jgi:hypothetical protein
MLRLRSEPKIDKRNPRVNVIAELPAGQQVVRISGKKGDEFFEVETTLNGTHVRGFAAAQYLRPVKVPRAIPVAAPPGSTPGDRAIPKINRDRQSKKRKRTKRV